MGKANPSGQQLPAGLRHARAIQELFGVRNRTGFMALFTLIALRNGGLLDVTDLAKEAGISRPTVMAHLDAVVCSGRIRC